MKKSNKNEKKEDHKVVASIDDSNQKKQIEIEIRVQNCPNECENNEKVMSIFNELKEKYLKKSPEKTNENTEELMKIESQHKYTFFSIFSQFFPKDLQNKDTFYQSILEGRNLENDKFIGRKIYRPLQSEKEKTQIFNQRRCVCISLLKMIEIFVPEFRSQKEKAINFVKYIENFIVASTDYKINEEYKCSFKRLFKQIKKNVNLKN